MTCSPADGLAECDRVGTQIPALREEAARAAVRGGAMTVGRDATMVALAFALRP